MTTTPGRFIVLEGIDGAGTTTHSKLLADWLRGIGHPVIETTECTDLPIGRMIRAIVDREKLAGNEDAPDPSALLHLFAADRADHLARRIKPALRDGVWVVCDRYYHSSMAYQGADAYEANKRFRTPDLTVWLDVPVGVAMDRLLKRGEKLQIHESHDNLLKVRRGYADCFARLGPGGDGEPYAGVKVTKLDPIRVVQKTIQHVVTERLLGEK